MSFDLARFEQAQDRGQFDAALAELRAGHKRSHWIWYVLPQLSGLGSSPMAIRYGLDGAAEARAYLEHRLLRARLVSVTEAVHDHLCNRGARIERLMGSRIDAQKLVSSMTLFEHVATALHRDAPSDELARLGAMATAILDAAAAQGFPRCAFTTARL